MHDDYYDHRRFSPQSSLSSWIGALVLLLLLFGALVYFRAMLRRFNRLRRNEPTCPSWPSASSSSRCCVLSLLTVCALSLCFVRSFVHSLFVFGTPSRSSYRIQQIVEELGSNGSTGGGSSVGGGAGTASGSGPSSQKRSPRGSVAWLTAIISPRFVRSFSERLAASSYKRHYHCSGKPKAECWWRRLRAHKLNGKCCLPIWLFTI